MQRQATRDRSSRRSSSKELLAAYAAAAPGLEPLVAQELAGLGLTPNVEPGGVSFRGSLETVGRANLWLRTASRVIIRVAEFRAQAFHELERLARALPWERYLAAGSAVRFRITSRKSRLYHTGAIAQRLAEAIEHRLGKGISVEPGADRDIEGEAEDVGDMDVHGQLFVVRVVHDCFTVSADSSGALLHQRGYRKAVGKAPVRETLAAAMVMASGWDGSAPLIDPLCGSGTIPIEGALLARRIAPGLKRKFAFESWPSFTATTWEEIRAEAESRSLSKALGQIAGSDRDAGAIEAAMANAERAGVVSDIDFSVRAISALEACTAEAGHVVTNPPYGVRVGQAERLRDLYARLGQVLRSKCPGWRFTTLSANARLERELRLDLESRLQTRNGGIPVKVLTGAIPARGLVHRA